MSNRNVLKAPKEIEFWAASCHPSVDAQKAQLHVIEHIAKLCHTNNKALCEFHGDMSHAAWDDLPSDKKCSISLGVLYVIVNDVTLQDIHEHWLWDKNKNGWMYGEVKDVVNKIHPSLRAFDELGNDIKKLKDQLFYNTIMSFLK